MHKLHIAVIGTASDSLPEIQLMLAFEVGKAVIEKGCRLLSGGMGGVMKHSARGAHAASDYQSGDVIGILPSYDGGDANSYVDIPLPTGLGVARNAVLMAACDGVIALDGGSGTLSEIALAWQMKKPIACIGEEGWQHRLASLALDDRREDSICILGDVTDISIFIDNVRACQKQAYRGIGKRKFSLNTMSAYLQKQFPKLEDSGPLKLLGTGSEGAVLTNGQHVYKLFYPNDYGMLLFSNLAYVANQLARCTLPNPPLPRFEVFKEELTGVRYPYFDSRLYAGGNLMRFIPFLKKLKSIGLCLSNIKAENLRVTEEAELIYVDIGRDVIAYSDAMFYSCCQRAFITAWFTGHPQIKAFYRYSNDCDDFSLVANDPGVSLSRQQLVKKFSTFYKEVMSES